MKRDEAWRAIGGAVALFVIAGLLLSTPSMLFAQKVQIVDTDLRDSNAGRSILARMNLGDARDLASVPRQLGGWNESQEFQDDRVAALLNTNILLSRDYQRDDVFQPVNLLIIQSSNVSSFHPAVVCYRAQGYDVADDGGRIVNVVIPNFTWAQQHWLSKDEQDVFDGNLSAKLLEVTKAGPNGTIEEKRVALYVYLKREDWRVTDQVTWVRLEMTVSPDTSGPDVLPILGDLMKEVVPNLFVFKLSDERTLGESLIDHFGFAGAGMMVVAIAIPCWPIALAVGRSARAPKP